MPWPGSSKISCPWWDMTVPYGLHTVSAAADGPKKSIRAYNLPEIRPQLSISGTFCHRPVTEFRETHDTDTKDG